MLNQMPVAIDDQFTLDDSHPYFDGHFDHKKILPAVAQISLCIAHHNQHRNQHDSQKILFNRARFYKEIQPGRSVSIRRANHGNSKMVFEFFDQTELCSKITFSIV